jgi:predicted metal-dependent phosphoesterase TrpH
VIDLHLHTTASDGRCTPRQLVERIRAAGITIFSVTDHDTVAGLAEAAAEAERLELEFVPGIEVTAVAEGKDVHVLGYFIDPAGAGLAAFLVRQRQARIDRARHIAERLAGLGAPIDVEALIGAAVVAGGRAIARPQLAQALVAAGHAASISDAFDRYLANDRPAYLPHTGGSPAEAVDAIHRAGGIASLAHPGIAKRDYIIEPLAEAGLNAIEAYHSDHDPAATEHYRSLAQMLNIAVSGGSDYHGEGMRRAELLGHVGLPAEAFERLKSSVRSGTIP